MKANGRLTPAGDGLNQPAYVGRSP